MLYFVPLGYLSYNNALISWTIFNLLFVIGCIYLLYISYFKTYKLNGLILVATLFFSFSPVKTTIFCSQTNFIVLYLLLLMKKYSNTGYAGIFLSLAMFTKLYMIIFLLVFIITKNWNAVIYFILSVLSLVGLTIAIFGADPVISYVFNNPLRRIPQSLFFEGINQSLHSVLLRSKLISINEPMVYLYIVGGVLFVTGVYLFFLLKKKLYGFIWAILLLVGLLIYPATLSHYSVVLLFIVFQFFDKKTPLGFSSYLNIPIIGILYFLCWISVFSAICFLLGLLIIKSIKPSLFYKFSFY